MIGRMLYRLAPFLCTLFLFTTVQAQEERIQIPSEEYLSPIQIVAALTGPMPTGVTVSDRGRIFINFPRWGDEVPYTVGLLANGEVTPFPNEDMNEADTSLPTEHFLSVQSVVMGPDGRLWVLDTGRIEWAPTISGGAKLVALDPDTGEVLKKIVFPDNVATPETYLNDVRFDLTRGTEGLAFITDSSSSGKNALIVVDLATGDATRRLIAHPSTRAVPRFLPRVEGRALMNRPAEGSPSHMTIGADGVAVGPKGEQLYYTVLSGRELFSVGIDDLVGSIPDTELGARVINHGDKGGASDGLESDTTGAVYLTDYEHNAIHRREADGTMTTLVHDPRVLWPDTLSLAADGYLYFTANQLHRQPGFHQGVDKREKPYMLFRVKVDREPVRLRSAK